MSWRLWCLVVARKLAKLEGRVRISLTAPNKYKGDNIMSVKAGVKTTEFWVSVMTALAGLGAVFGVFTPEEATNITSSVTVAIGGIMATISTIFYAFSRGKAKMNITADNLTQIITAIEQIATSVKPTPEEEKPNIPAE